MKGTVEGGFMGRTNKLVDGCYSYWQGALLPLLQQLGPELLQQMGIPEPVPKRTPDESPGDAADPIVVPSFPSKKPADPMQQAQDAIDRCQVQYISYASDFASSKSRPADFPK